MLALKAMQFAREAHSGQVRKYTGNPYFDHVCEVAGIVSTVSGHADDIVSDEMIAIAFLHDVIEDCGVTYHRLFQEFGFTIAISVLNLSDMEEGNRKERKAMSLHRLSKSVPWVQTIKCADLISNISSIAIHDPKFAKLYISEAKDLLGAMERADKNIKNMALAVVKEADNKLLSA
jgi:(p)ppGpp synthase/HD superfamily hydrolase